MKKIFLVLILIASLLTVATACQTDSDDDNDNTTNTNNGDIPDEIKEGIAFDISGDIAVDVGKTIGLKIKNLATGMETSNLLWSSDNEDVAKVDINGNLTGISQGSTNITATTLDGKYSVSAKVNVMLRLSGVHINYEDYDLEVGDTVQLSAGPIPENFIGATYTWISSVESVASVDENGLVTAHKLGTTDIIVSAEPGGYTAICRITVGKYADSITLAPKKLTINRGVSMQLEFSMLPVDATSRPRWKSSDESVAIVNSGGVITAISCGEVTITVTTTNGLKSSCNVTVISALTGFEFVEETITVSKGSKTEPNIVYFPEDATNKNLIWTSSDSKVAMIKYGKIVALKNGTVTLTAESVDGGYIQTLTVTVNNPLVSIEFAGEKDAQTGKYPTLHMQCTDTLKLAPIITPFDADEIPCLEWTSSNVNVAAVSADGTLSAYTIGTTTITVTSPNGITASFDLEVTKKIYPVKEFSTLSSTYYMNRGDLLAVDFTYIPAESQEDAVISGVLCSNSEVAIWNEEHGMIIAQSIGECEIEFVISNFDGTEAKCKIKIKVVDDGVSFDDEYRSDTHSLRDAFNQQMKQLTDKLASHENRVSVLVNEIESLRNIIRNIEAETENIEGNEGNNESESEDQPDIDTCKALLKQYEDELVNVKLEIAKTESDIEACKSEHERREEGLAKKYSCVKENITYDPENDPYPDKANDEIVKVTDHIENVMVDLKYATEDNETGKKIYDFTDAYLRYGTIKKLDKVAKFFVNMDEGVGYRLIIIDAYRPTAAQDVIWNLLGQSQQSYGDFCRGNAICVMLVNLDGSRLEGDNSGLVSLLSQQMIRNGFLALDEDGCFVDADNYDVENELLSDKVIVPAKNAEVLISQADETLMNDTDSYVHFIDESAINSEWNILFETDVTVTNFKFLAIDNSEDIVIENELFTLDELTVETPLVISTYVNDTTVDRGISYTDSDGETKYFLIKLLVEDGLVLLESFTA